MSLTRESVRKITASSAWYLRTGVARAALQGLLASSETVARKPEESYPEAYARRAVDYADALLLELERRPLP